MPRFRRLSTILSNSALALLRRRGSFSVEIGLIGVRNTHHLCVVGSGPAGFYTAQQLLKSDNGVKVDVVERLPVPFGLVRFGVAPDHPEVKNCINSFNQVAKNERFSYFGNVSVGRDVSVKDLLSIYSGVILAYGAEEDRKLGIPGEDLNGVYSAKSFVGWYNGIPAEQDLKPNLSYSTAVILGIGNVALDIARILLTPIELLKETDITAHALDALAKSQVREVYLVGRRGPLQVAFTIKELREMVRLPGTRHTLNPADFEGVKDIVQGLPRPKRRLTELMLSAVNSQSNKDAKTRWILKLLRSPVAILPSRDSSSHVGAVKLAVNRLEGQLGGNQNAVSTGQTEEVPCGLVIKSVGYMSLPIGSDVPFDARSGVIRNDNGRVVGVPGLYCTGWVRRGPRGVILDTMSDAFAVGKTVLQDIRDQKLRSSDPARSLSALLAEKGVSFVSFDEWERIGQEEVRAGSAKNKPREKITRIEEMMRIAKQTSPVSPPSEKS